MKDIVPRLLAVLQDKKGMPALVFDGEYFPARQSFSRGKQSKGKVGRRQYLISCQNLVESLSQALSWLHLEHLVHMEVSLDSVLVGVSESKPSRAPV